MIYIFDTHYFEDKAKTACVSINQWEDKEAVSVITETISGIKEYESGSFYLRELPCIISLLKTIELNEKDIIVIDGFVILDDDNKNGLGGYLFDHLSRAIPVIGVAKNDFVKLQNNKRQVFRGESKKPVYITAMGIDLDTASKLIGSMEGPYRIPTLLKMADQKCREI
jgi:deoxyinosine 3'endonuclease (endonuclease V)